LSEVNCLYCGKKIAEDLAECPHCGGVSHYQKRGYRAGARTRFVLFFIAVTVFCLLFIFWLPR
jgi:predicted nucleic acid-binding Zn ribbon protein